MKVAHLSDVHLGFGAETGGQGRSADVIRAFETALNRIAELEPDVVVVAGDLFDRPGVTAPPIAAFSRAAAQFHGRLPEVPILVAAGSRDTPLDVERPGPLAVVGALPGVEVAVVRPKRVAVAGGAGNVVLLPHRAVLGPRRPQIAPEPGARWNVLVTYARTSPQSAHALPVDLEGWDYVALGSVHEHRVVRPRACYSGSLERVGPDPWAEAALEKGFVVADTSTGEINFWPTRARAVVSLAPVEATGGGLPTVARRLSEALAGVPGGVDGKLIRIPIRGLSPDDLATLDRELIEPVRRRAALVRVEALPGQGASHAREGSGSRSEFDDEQELRSLLGRARRLMDDGARQDRRMLGS